MSILDDAIREHLALKRAHGADEAELKRLEDEAFGPPARPDEPNPFAEAPTEFLGVSEGEGDVQLEGGRRINIADLQEAPPAEPAPPTQEEQPAMEHEAAPEAAPEPPGPGPSTAERHALSEQPTELFDVEAQMEPELAADAPSPSDEELAAAERTEPRLEPGGLAEEIAPASEEQSAASAADFVDEDEEEDEFWSEQRLSDELDQALEAPLTDEHELPSALPDDEYTDEHELPPATAEPEEDTGEHDRLEQRQHIDSDHETEGEHEDVLEDTPDFLEDAPEDDELWFEQRPPKDFDFDD